MKKRKKFLIAMDGECSLCNKSIQFVAKNLSAEHKERISFCSLGSEAGKLLLNKTGLTPDALILFDGEDYLIGQVAAIELATLLRFPWRMLSGFRFFPNFLREWGYNKIAQHRHFFGKEEDSCSIPENMDVKIIVSEEAFLRLYAL